MSERVSEYQWLLKALVLLINLKYRFKLERKEGGSNQGHKNYGGELIRKLLLTNSVILVLEF